MMASSAGVSCGLVDSSSSSSVVGGLTVFLDEVPDLLEASLATSAVSGAAAAGSSGVGSTMGLLIFHMRCFLPVLERINS